MSKPVYWWCMKGIGGVLCYGTTALRKEDCLARYEPLRKGESIVRIRVEEVKEKP